MTMLDDFGFEVEFSSGGATGDGVPFVVFAVYVSVRPSARCFSGRRMIMKRKMSKHDFDQFAIDLDTALIPAVLAFRAFEGGAG